MPLSNARYCIKKKDGEALRFAYVNNKLKEIALMKGKPLKTVRILKKF